MTQPKHGEHERLQSVLQHYFLDLVLRDAFLREGLFDFAAEVQAKLDAQRQKVLEDFPYAEGLHQIGPVHTVLVERNPFPAIIPVSSP